ncbi:MAG: STAS domain-containing protein [Prevotella sp.]|jgi:anti-anti-sigma factor|nr:STAS domain-containing protein [Prevotella sp.]
MTKIIKEGGKTIIQTGARIDTMNANQFEEDIKPALVDGGVDLEMDCSELTYMASSGLRVIQKTMRTVMQLKGKFKMTNVNPDIYKVLAMTGFTKFMTVEKKTEEQA